MNKTVLDKMIGFQVDLHMYGDSLIKEMQALVRESLKDLEAKLLTHDTASWTAVKVAKMIADAQKLNDRLSREMQDRINGDLPELGNIGMSAAYGSLPVDLLEAAGISLTMPSIAQMAAVLSREPIRIGDGAATVQEIFQTIMAGRQNVINKTLRLGVMEGQGIQEMVRNLVGTRKNRYSDGLLDGSRRNVESMVRTMINSVSNRAAQQVYTANTDVISKLQWHSTLDNRTSPICRGRDGKIYPVDSGPRPPAHVRCRSFMVPVLKSWKSLGIDASKMPEGTRASMNGQVPESTNYSSWLRDQPKSRVQEILGIEKAKFFMENDISLDKFVNESGRSLNISELRSRYEK